MDNTKEIIDKDVNMYPGAAIDTADDEKTDSQLEKERTKTLDSNPRDEQGPKD